MDYEKAYKDALGVIRELHEAVSTDKDYLSKNSYLTEKFEQAFPELKEPEDEKVRKSLIEFVNGMYKGSCTEEARKERDEYIAYLEKQGRQKPTEDEDREYACQLPEHYTRRELMIYNLGIFNGKKMVEDAINKTEQKPNDWSEEDEKMINTLIIALPQWANGNIAMLPSQAEEYVERLKSLKDRVQPQPQQEWSEEDLYKIENALFGTYAVDVATRLLNKIKSLRPQPKWKPSEEQMKALYDAAFEANWESMNIDLLESLYNDLKKLTE